MDVTVVRHTGISEISGAVTIKINGKEITSALDLRSYLYAETGIGDTIKMEIYRNGKQETVELKLTNQTI